MAKRRQGRNIDHVSNRREDMFLERIPEDLYEDLIRTLTVRYGFVNGPQNGGRMRLAEYFLGIAKSTAGEFFQFVQDTIYEAMAHRLPGAVLPDGFALPAASLLPLEEQGGFSFGCFDAALTEKGLQLIEAQGLPTYHLTAAFISSFLRRKLAALECSVFVNAPEVEWSDFLELKREIIAFGAPGGIVLADRELGAQKTGFDFNATQRELDIGLDIIDSRLIFERDGRLFYRVHETDSEAKQLHRLYSRVLALEAIEDDNYPNNPQRWRFRFDRAYKDFIFVNHPAKSFEVSKHILPYIRSPINPTCYELSDVARDFRAGNLGYSEFVWKHKWGVAGRGALLLPNAHLLDRLTRERSLDSYVAQGKVEFERFHTGDGQTKIVELRFMSVQSSDRLLVVPMARIGHVEMSAEGRSVYCIHFGDNNRPGYGFCPVLIFADS